MEVHAEVHRAYWWFACERQRIFEQRMAGHPGPWTDDPILAQYKFTNAWRASDRATQFLIREVIYGNEEQDPDDLLIRIVLFRLFSRPATWRALEEAAGPVTRRTLLDGSLARALGTLRSRGPIYTNAFILCANSAFGYPRKHDNHLALLREMAKNRRLAKAVGHAGSLRELYLALCEYPLIGQFMGYQLAIDINYSELTDFSEDDFTVAGPGAERGIRKVFPDARRPEMASIIQRMVAEQDERCEDLGFAPPRLFGRRLHAIDCQNLFCELDKYARVRFPELASSRRRIKNVFRSTAEPLALFYPPKWGLSVPTRA